jgi:hypothetical protein
MFGNDNYDPTVRPLGKLLVAKSYSTRVGEKTTKTDAVKHVPVHPTLAAMLAEWKLGGWAIRRGHRCRPESDPITAVDRIQSGCGGPPRTRSGSGAIWIPDRV